MLQHELFFDHALLPSGWGRNVRISVRDGILLSVEEGASPSGANRMAGIALPGLPNLHSHAFQRGIAGLTERRGPQQDSFWTWREMMYRFADRLSPEDVHAIAAFAYMEMLEAGFTTVGEFHYLHHRPDGRPYDDIGEMAKAIAAAAAEAHIGLTLLPSFYAHGGFGGAPPVAAQRRFINDPDRFLKLVERSRVILAAIPAGRIGIAPHSLRAVTPEELRLIREASPNGPIHIHAAERASEVEESLAALGRRPVEWLIGFGIDSRWCVIHATHTTGEERRALARSGAVAGLCPITEASLGDGIFNAADYLTAGGRFGIGTDSNIGIDAAVELRQLEYTQRLTRCARNVMALEEGQSTGRQLFASALSGGAKALQQPAAAFAPGLRADIVLLDEAHPDLCSRQGDEWLDAWIFAAGRTAVKTVLAGGGLMVEGGRHRKRLAIEARYKRAIANLLAQ